MPRRQTRRLSRRPTKRPRRPNEAAKAYIDTAEQEGLIKSEERRLLQSIVDFGDTLVREVMTPRPDIVAIRDTATVGDVRALFREQEYSRFPVYKEASTTSPASSSSRTSSTLSSNDDGTADHRRCCGRRWSCPRPSAFPSC